jgi:hypothetical protein
VRLYTPRVPAALDRPVAALSAAWSHPRWGLLFKAVVGYVVLIEIVVQGVFGRVRLPIIGLDIGRYALAIPRGEILGGAVIGALYALVGMGLILVYRANRIINFAQAQLGAVPAIVALLLITARPTSSPSPSC